MYSGSLTDNGTAATALNKTGAGRWILTSPQNHTGTTTITAGVLQTAVTTNGFWQKPNRFWLAETAALRADVNTTFSNDLGAYPITLSANSTIDVGQLTTATVNTTISVGTVSLPGAYTLNTTGSDGLNLSLPTVVGSTAADKVISNSLAAPGRLLVQSYTETDASTRKISFDGTGTTVAGNIQQNGANALTVAKTGHRNIDPQPRQQLHRTHADSGRKRCFICLTTHCRITTNCKSRAAQLTWAITEPIRFRALFCKTTVP